MKVRYLREEEMQELAYDAAIAQGFDATQSQMLASCARNIYAIGCMYPPGTVTLLQEICREPAGEGRGVGDSALTLRRRPDATAAFKRHGRRTDGSRKSGCRAPPRVKPSCLQVGSTVRVRRSREGMREDRRLA